MPVEFIAEFCQNHNGDVELLQDMVHAAAESGARVGKIQTIFAENLSYRPRFEEGIKVDGKVASIKRPYQSEYDRLKQLEVDFEAHAHFVQLCERFDLIPMTTCFARVHVKDIAKAGFRKVKVASYDCASFPMLRELKENFEELIVSTGATFDDEIATASRIINDHPHRLLHCVTIYPTPLSEMNLARMEYLRTLSGNVGFSDHSLVARDGITAAKAAVYFGASTVERHFTMLSADATKDGPVSVGPEHIAELIVFDGLDRDEQLQELNERHPGWESCVGERQRCLTNEEMLNRDYYKGRFASRRSGYGPEAMVFNWEETILEHE